jgi:hypothetical protein
MDLQALFYAVGATGFFTSRAFLPAFCTALFLRYGEHLPLLGNVPFLQRVGAAEPMWFTSNLTILALGALAALEVGATKIPEARELLDGVHKYAKSGLAALSTIGVLNAADLQFIGQQVLSEAGLIDNAIGIIVAGTVWLGATLRNGMFALLQLADPDDSLGIQNLLSWSEDVWAFAGVILFFVYPLLISLLVLGIFGLLYAVRRYREYREDRSRRPCPSCGTPAYPSALACPSCHTVLPEPQAVGFFGTAIDKPAGDRAQHALRLAEKRRCPACAARLEKRRLPQNCTACGTAVLATPEARQAYLAMVRRRLPKVLGISFLISLIPAVGIIPGIIYYRITLQAPFRAYIPAGRGFLLKWLLRIALFFLISLQLVPGLGGLVVPIMALLSYLVYRAAFTAQFRNA